MGTDICIAAVVWPNGRSPRWDEGAAWIDGLDADELEGIANVLVWDDEDVRTRLRTLIRELRDVVDPEQRWRGVDWFDIGNFRLTIAGGSSAGDDPNNEFRVVNDAIVSGLAAACGLDEAPPAPLDSLQAIVDRARRAGLAVDEHIYEHLQLAQEWLERVRPLEQG